MATFTRAWSVVGGGFAAGDLFGGQRARGRHRACAAGFRFRESGLRLRFFHGGGEAIELRAEHGFVEAREHLTLLHAIAGFDEHGGDAAAFAFGADRHVVARVDRAGEGDRRRDGACAGRGGADEGQRLLLWRPLRRRGPRAS